MLTAETQNAKQSVEQAVCAFRKVRVARIGATDMGTVGTRGGVRIDVKRELIAFDVLRLGTHARNRFATERDERVARPEGAFRRADGSGGSILGNGGNLQRHATDCRGGNSVWLVAQLRRVLVDEPPKGRHI